VSVMARPSAFISRYLAAALSPWSSRDAGSDPATAAHTVSSTVPSTVAGSREALLACSSEAGSLLFRQPRASTPLQFHRRVPALIRLWRL